MIINLKITGNGYSLKETINHFGLCIQIITEKKPASHGQPAGFKKRSTNKTKKFIDEILPFHNFGCINIIPVDNTDDIKPFRYISHIDNNSFLILNHS